MERFFTRVASRCAYAMGNPFTFMIAVGSVVLWAVTGPYFHYSDTWQLIINTATTVLTFLAVFLIQNSQNRDGGAIQAKLDEILRSIAEARSGFVGIEKLTDAEINGIRVALEREVLQTAHGEADAEEPSVDELLDARIRQEQSLSG